MIPRNKKGLVTCIALEKTMKKISLRVSHPPSSARDANFSARRRPTKGVKWHYRGIRWDFTATQAWERFYAIYVRWSKERSKRAQKRKLPSAHHLANSDHAWSTISEMLSLVLTCKSRLKLARGVIRRILLISKLSTSWPYFSTLNETPRNRNLRSKDALSSGNQKWEKKCSANQRRAVSRWQEILTASIRNLCFLLSRTLWTHSFIAISSRGELKYWLHTPINQ